MKIAVFGGAFNPVHREHVNLARCAVQELGLDKLIIMPTAVSPHKGGKLSADFWQRYEMCRLAFSCIPQAEISNFELTKGGVSYTYLTCEHIASLYPDAERYLIIGGDMLEDFPNWSRPQRILELFTLAACAREDASALTCYRQTVERELNTEVRIITYVGEKVSSTEIRTLAALGEDFSAFVNGVVCQYVEESGIYLLEDADEVRKMLTPSRWAHTVRVAVVCAKNASRVNLTEREAITMALMHDCAKYLPADSPYLKGFTPPEGVPGPVLHQYSGAYVAEKYFGVSEELAEAIRYHTTGRENMSEAGMLLYLADMLEPARTFPGVEELRREFKRDIRGCFKCALAHQVEYLLSQGGEVDQTTLKAYNYYKNGKN